MAQGSIKKADLGKLIEAVRRDGRFFGPIDQGDGACLAEVTPDAVLKLDYANFTLPPKRMFFPRSEVIATHEASGMAAVPVQEGQVVLFGVRPCDALALTYLDKVFVDKQFTDPYYRSRRERTLVISLACREPAATCFCTSVHGAPDGRAGADILAVEVGEALVLESLTKAGEAFMTHHAKLFASPTPAQRTACDAQASEAAKKVSAVPIDGLKAKLSGCAENAGVWDDIAERCLACGVCTYLCPTCHCFGLYDEQVGQTMRRVRAQDACTFPTFTQEASGHNPRTRHGMRMRQRVMHKFCYATENFGDIFCVGCGRCVASCPAHLDIRETITEVSQ